jgi:hypothetical protein
MQRPPVPADAADGQGEHLDALGRARAGDHRPGEGSLTEPTAETQPWSRARISYGPPSPLIDGFLDAMRERFVAFSLSLHGLHFHLR